MNGAADTAKVSKAASGITMPIWSLLVPVVVLLALAIVLMQAPDGRLHLWVLNVGEGDAMLVRTPRGHTVLIDGGPGATPLLNGLGQHLPFWQHSLDVVVVTEPGQGQLMGLPDVLQRFEVGQVVQTEFTATTQLAREWLHLLEEKKVPMHHVKRGDSITFADEPDVSLHVLSPGAPSSSQSIVLKLAYSGHNMLLEGDAQAQVEEEIVSTNDDLSSEVLKVGHYGSDKSLSPSFLALVRPDVAIISVGDNRFGYPSQDKLDMLKGVGALVYRTDLDGTIEIIADKERLWVSSER